MSILAAAVSAPVTQWGPRILLTALMLSVIALGFWGMRRGWRARAARQGHIPAPPEPPAGLLAQAYAEGAGEAGADLPDAAPAGIPGMYVATTTAGDLLDRIVVHGLAHRGRALLLVRPEGVLVDRVGEVPLWIPRDALRAVRLGNGQAQKAYEAGGLILLTWRLGDVEVETGFRGDDPEQHIAAAQALSELVPSAGGAR